MFDTLWPIYLDALWVMLIMAFLAWLLSLKLKNVAIVDSLWSMMFLAAAMTYQYQSTEINLRSLILFSLVALWSIRLSLHLSIRNWGEPEDRRYREIRVNNQPNFEWKSLYLVFGLQAVLAWVISVPLLIAFSAPVELSLYDLIPLSLFLLGLIFESVADLQLLNFRFDRTRQKNVLRSGLWHYSRHPNYFGEFCIWWSFYLFALPSGGWWAVYAPALMSILLLKVSGVGLMEKNMPSRRPDYADYMATTNAFFPGLPRASSTKPTTQTSSEQRYES